MDEAFLTEVGYECPRRLPDGTWAALMPLSFTTALVIGLDRTGHKRRYCYETREEAEAALAGLVDGVSDPMGGWVAKRPQD